jgi:hypothetical protein
MPVGHALDLVFKAQELCLAGPVDDGADRRRTAHGVKQDVLSRPEAIELTARIRDCVDQVCDLLLEAHDRGAWIALGYRSWHVYVKREFGISRSRSYQLLDQARVRQALSEAAGVSQVSDISPYAALQVKGQLPELVAEVRRRQRPEMSGAAAHRLIAEVVAEARARSSHQVSRSELDEIGLGVERLADCLAYICALPACHAADQIERTALQDSFQALCDWVGQVEAQLQRGPVAARAG